MRKDKFMCSQCGACCKHLSSFHGLYDFLDRGDGVCKNFQEKTKKCSIYPERPDMCRIEFGYQFFKTTMTFDEYINKTNETCKYLQSLN